MKQGRNHQPYPFDLERLASDPTYMSSAPMEESSVSLLSLFTQQHALAQCFFVSSLAANGKSKLSFSFNNLAFYPTLAIEVSYPFHSHLIGRSGRNINRIMEDTGTRIHFPDRNRIAGESKSNSVIIRGRLAGLEMARQRIRVIRYLFGNFNC